MIEKRTHTPTEEAGRGARTAVLLTTLALLTACVGCELSGGHHCTLIDSPAGIGVEVAPKLAHKVADATLTVCWDGTCRKPALGFHGIAPEGSQAPGDPVMTTGTPDAPEAPPERNPPRPWPVGSNGFAKVPRLPDKPTRVTLTLKDPRGATLLDRQLTVTPKPNYPNGRTCSPGGPYAGLIVTEQGSLTER
jgi:hypothetical protein